LKKLKRNSNEFLFFVFPPFYAYFLAKFFISFTSRPYVTLKSLPATTISSDKIFPDDARFCMWARIWFRAILPAFLTCFDGSPSFLFPSDILSPP